MRAKSMALILVALGCGLVATIGVSQVMKENAQAEAVPMGSIVVAVASVDVGARVTGEMVKVEEWPQDRIPLGAVTTLEELEGKYAKQRLYIGEPLLMDKLLDQTRADSLTIPPGWRVSAVKVNEESAVANLIKPGDHVDVIAFIKNQGGNRGAVTSKTILKDIKVFAVNAETHRADEMGEEGQIDAKTVSLLVKPKQVQMLVLAEQIGELELSLRHPDDSVEEDEGTLTVKDLLGDDSSSGGGNGNEGGSTSSAGWLSMLPQSKPQNEEGDAEQPADAPFQMEVINGADQVVTWEWKDQNKLPVVVSDSGSGASAKLPSAASAAEPSVIPTDLPPGLVPSPLPPTPASPFLGEA
ncbi:MAG: Flp pilus assembly protein CpaB [Planctomycetales bacterium]|nr:Flp pilus assembly protein CpaB [Planctomycetales bacterium]